MFSPALASQTTDAALRARSAPDPYTHQSHSATHGVWGLNKEPQLKKSTLLGTVVLVLAAAACLSLAGCNTVEGAGKDIENAGEGIQNAAD